MTSPASINGSRQFVLKEREDLSQYTGVYVSMNELIGLQASHAKLDLSGQKKSLAIMAGAHRSSFRGRGIDFDEVRMYAPGDDIRHIDWRVTARTGKTHTKLYHEERERPIYLVVDQRQSMFFGTQDAFKSVVAARTAAYLAWAAKDHGDRIGGFLFNDTEVHEVRPKEGKRGIQQLFRLLIQFNQTLSANNPETSGSRSSITTAIEGLHQVVKPGSLVFIISDFQGFDDITLQHLSLVAKHSDMVAAHISDPMEQRLPATGSYGFTDGKRSIKLNTSNHDLRKRFRTRFIEQHQRVKEQLTKIGVPTIDISTGQSVSTALAEALGMKSRKRKKR